MGSVKRQQRAWRRAIAPQAAQLERLARVTGEAAQAEFRNEINRMTWFRRCWLGLAIALGRA